MDIENNCPYCGSFLSVEMEEFYSKHSALFSSPCDCELVEMILKLQKENKKLKDQLKTQTVFGGRCS